MMVYKLLMDYQFPKQLRYQRVNPRGFPCFFKEWVIDPVSGNKIWTQNDIIRFEFGNNSNGVFDALRSYIQIYVSTTIDDCPVGLLQIDNSAQSFIHSMVLSSNSAQIQRIQQYSTLAAYLNDCGLCEYITQGRQQQGFGSGSYDNMPFGRNITGNQCVMQQNTTAKLINSLPLTKPTIPSHPLHDESNDMGSRFAALKTSKKLLSGTNPFLFPNQTNKGTYDPALKVYQKCFKQTGYYVAMRSQYYTNYVKSNYLQTPKSPPMFSIELDRDVFAQGGYVNTPFTVPQNTFGTIHYKTIIPDIVKQHIGASVAPTNLTNHKFTCSNYGYANLYSPQFSRGTFQPFISPTVRQASIQNGVFVLNKQPIYRRRFKIPLLSAVIGMLVNSNNFSLIPLKSINNCLLQLTMDQHAMFTSGYKDISQMDIAGMKFQQQRRWSIDRIQYKMHTYHYVDEQVQNYIQASLYKQIQTINNFWMLCALHKVPGGSGPSSSYTIGCRSRNLTQLVCLFVPTDFQIYSFCRKHYRLSNNITSFQLRIGIDYWPPNAHKGNAGNVVSNNLEDDNAVFLENIYFAMNCMFSATNPQPRINAYNFSLNQRPYQVTNRSTYFQLDMKQGGMTYVFEQDSVNDDTALGMCWHHQNRCVGKAAFVVNFSPYSNEQTFLKGINAANTNNFEVMFETSGQNVFPRDQILYCFGNSSVFVKYSDSGIQTVGR